ncbi:GyrI-like domain-containing protein [Streptococcus dentiloxodontae]
MKYEWRKAEKELYGVKTQPTVLEVKRQQFITIKGQGNPNDTEFSNQVSSLYSLAYGIKMAYKKAKKNEMDSQAITDFTVYPLEGLWQQEENPKQDKLVKDRLSYKIMIQQPDFISQELFLEALEKVKIKKPNPFYDKIDFEEMTDGKSIQVLHIGSYDDEPESFAKLDAFAKKHSLQRSSQIHREIYLSNAQRTAEDKLKTILRYQVEEI